MISHLTLISLRSTVCHDKIRAPSDALGKARAATKAAGKPYSMTMNHISAQTLCDDMLLFTEAAIQS